MAEILNVSDTAFDQKTTEGLVLVEFWAPWCGTCRMLLPVIEELQEMFDGKLKVLKANIDDLPQKAKQFSISTLPTLLFFKNGQLVDREEGFRLKIFLAKKIEELLN